jgi:hypothetical protein
MHRTVNTLHLFIAATALLLVVLAAPAARSVTGASFHRLAMAGEPAAPDKCTATYFPLAFGSPTLVTWRDHSDNEDGFTVEWWRKGKGGGWALQATQDVPANTTSVYFAPTGGNNDRYRVRAFNANGVSKWSNWANP